MKAILYLFTLLFTITAAAQSSQKIIVKFKQGIFYQVDYKAKKLLHPVLNTMAEINQLEALSSMVNRGANEKANLKSMDLVRDIHFLTFPANIDIDIIISSLLNTGLFQFVEKDFIGSGAGVNLTTPNDPNFPNLQWGLKNNGTFSGTAIPDADIDMDEAWDITTGDANTIVCVLDAGFKMDQPELSGRIWQNTGEIAGNGIDDDNNGYIDDVRGWDWANSDNDPTDDHGHGTNVGSIIAAKGNNASGMAGVNWNCKLMVGKILTAANSGFYSWWESGIYYAVANGAKVINMSVGGSSFSATMQAACDFAMANNVMIIVCMHNQNTSAPYYPAAYESTIAVGSTNDNDSRTVPFPWSAVSGSNYGSHIDLVAPGNYILGANYLNNNSYDYWCGTSQATPEVAGVVSLMLALKPDLTFTAARNILISTSQDRVGNPAEDVVGWDMYYGYGRLNARAALQAVLDLLPVKIGDVFANRRANYNEISWNTFTESNSREFIVEYSADRTHWQRVAASTAAGNSSTVKQYAVNHIITAMADAFYRVKAVDNDGSYIYSKIVRVNKQAVDFSIDKVIVNQGRINIYTTSGQNMNALVNMYSMDGKLLLSTRIQVQSGSSQTTLYTSLSGGRYQLVLSGANQKISQGIIVR